MTDGKGNATAGGYDAEDRREHLKMVQAVIGRMASNSFVLKGWSLTITVALLAIAAKETALAVALAALGPIAAFAGLDAFYLQQERRYRKLYERIVDGSAAPNQMNAAAENGESGLDALLSGTVLAFHLPILLATLATVAYLVAKLLT